MNKVENLVNEFINNSRQVDREINNIDNKHSKILNDANKTINNLTIDNFRNWKNQNDIGLKYPMTCMSKNFLGLKTNKFLNYFVKIIKKRITHIFEYSSMLDDIQIIKSLGGEKILNENPQNKTPGASKYRLVEGYSVTTRWLRYLYILNQINRFKLLENDQVWLDIGSYYGGLQGLVKKYYPDLKLIMVDFNHQLLRSYIYLKKMFPNANHILPSMIKNIKNKEQIPKGSILYVELEDFDELYKININLTTNFLV